MAAAKEISMDTAVGTVLLDMNSIFTLNEGEKMVLKVFLSG